MYFEDFEDIYDDIDFDEDDIEIYYEDEIFNEYQEDEYDLIDEEEWS